jgi:hypothetical protein
MQFQATKRNFVGLSLVTTAGPLAPATWLSFLGAAAAANAVGEILAEHWNIGREHAALIERFTAALQGERRCVESAEIYASLISTCEAKAKLTRYVLEEFVAHTNYLAFATGRSANLQIL